MFVKNRFIFKVNNIGVQPKVNIEIFKIIVFKNIEGYKLII